MYLRLRISPQSRYIEIQHILYPISAVSGVQIQWIQCVSLQPLVQIRWIRIVHVGMGYPTNVAVTKTLYTKFEANIPSGPRVMSRDFQKKSSTGQTDAWWSLVTVLHTSGWAMLNYISVQDLKQIYQAVQELWAFSIKELGRPNWCSEKPRHCFAYQ